MHPEPFLFTDIGDLRQWIDGAGIERVRVVVLFGPDNILREAARIAPSPDGTWTVNGLEVGRYRIQLDGDGTTVVARVPLKVEGR